MTLHLILVNRLIQILYAKRGDEPEKEKLPPHLGKNMIISLIHSRTLLSNLNVLFVVFSSESYAFSHSIENEIFCFFKQLICFYNSLCLSVGRKPITFGTLPQKFGSLQEYLLNIKCF